jgi:hypothetical protein
VRIRGARLAIRKPGRTPETMIAVPLTSERRPRLPSGVDGLMYAGVAIGVP